jgi:hypothetical protein
MHHVTVSLLGLLLFAGCRAASPSAHAAPTTPDPGPGPGAGMGCGIRGELLDRWGAPRFFTEVAAVPLDRSARVSTHSDPEGRFALSSECRRTYAVAARTDSGLALGLVWVEDGAVDVRLQAPEHGDEAHIHAERHADASRLRVLQLVPPTVLRAAEFDPDRCDARTNELRRIRADDEDPVARNLAGVALMEAGCSPCPGADESAALIGRWTEDRGLAEAWPFGYGRLFACSPGVHPHEEKFASVVRVLDPEFAARVVYGRYVEALAQLDQHSAERMAQLLDGPFAGTEFVGGLPVAEDLVDR